MQNLHPEISNLITICPYCNSKVILQFPVLDLYIYTNFDREKQFLVLKKEFSKKPENEDYLKTLLINTLNKKPFISRIILTKPIHEIINELAICGFLTNKDLKPVNNF